MVILSGALYPCDRNQVNY